MINVTATTTATVFSVALSAHCGSCVRAVSAVHMYTCRSNSNSKRTIISIDMITSFCGTYNTIRTYRMCVMHDNFDLLSALDASYHFIRMHSRKETKKQTTHTHTHSALIWFASKTRRCSALSSARLSLLPRSAPIAPARTPPLGPGAAPRTVAVVVPLWPTPNAHCTLPLCNFISEINFRYLRASHFLGIGTPFRNVQCTMTEKRLKSTGRTILRAVQANLASRVRTHSHAYRQTRPTTVAARKCAD